MTIDPTMSRNSAHRSRASTKALLGATAVLGVVAVAGLAMLGEQERQQCDPLLPCDPYV